MRFGEWFPQRKNPARRGVLAMAQFYFDLCTDGATVGDEDGLDLLDAATARREASRAAAEMMRDRCAAKAVPADTKALFSDQGCGWLAMRLWRIPL